MMRILRRLFDGTIRGFLTFCAFFPVEFISAFGALGGRLVYLFSKRRRVAYADLKSAFGDQLTEKKRWKIARTHFAHLGRTAVEIMRFPFLDKKYIDRYITIRNPERFFSLVAEDKGVVLLTGHVGNWELLQIVSGIFGKPIHVLARTQKYNRVNNILNELRQSHGSIAIRRGIGVRDLLRGLRRKELIGVVGDRDAGKNEGVIVSLFGRKTTFPTGAFELAKRTGAPVLPCFILRRKGVHHEIYVGEPIRCAAEPYEPSDLKPFVEKFVRHLEDFIRQEPSQWLWASKRWKYTWTKRLLILSDEKPGHVKQSEAIAKKIQTLETHGGRGEMEYRTETLAVQFKSAWHKKLFPWFAFFFIPWAQGRMAWLSFFFTPETQKKIRNSSFDFIISAGSSLIPLNLCLAQESRAKSIVLMKPGFPFNFFRYDLAVVPAHDTGMIPFESFRTLLTPSALDSEDLEAAKKKLHRDLRDPLKIRIAAFIGGPTRHYRMDLSDIEKLISILEKVSGRTGDYVATTSRRTPETVSRLLKQKLPRLPGCQMLVIAEEDRRPEIAGGMMALADILVVTEDSISMISEAVGAGKKVIVLSLKPEGLPAKHVRFREILAKSAAVVVASLNDLEEKITHIDKYVRPGLALREENEALRKKLQEIL